jgi:anion-transporting  ArsA/GET3 family ATPase
MASLLERRLVVVTGKGGTGKTTVACALGLAGAARGSRTLVVELGGHHRLPALFGSAAIPGTGEETQLEERLWTVSIDTEQAMSEWLRSLIGRVSTRVLTSSSTFRYFAMAAPGASELIALVEIARLTERYDLVVLDAPATGHALAMLRSPQTYAAIARVGPLATEGRRVRALLEDRERCAYVAVAHASEMAVSETLELEEQLRRLLDRDLDAVLVNGVVPRRFTREELARLEGVPPAEPTPAKAPRGEGRTRDGGEDDPAVRAAIHAARAISRRARMQQSQIARLRRQRFAGGAPPGVLTIPFEFGEVDLATVRAIADGLARKV